MLEFRRFQRKANSYLDRLIIHKYPRWLLSAIVFVYLLYRIAAYGYVGILYFFGLYILYLLVQFFTPLGLPDPDEDDLNHHVGTKRCKLEIPFTMRTSDRPVLRSITEFNLWKKIMLTLVASLLCTYSSFFLIPVYWPFLLSYFLTLVFFSVRKHWYHMRKYGYSLADFGRKHVDTI